MLTDRGEGMPLSPISDKEKDMEENKPAKVEKVKVFIAFDPLNNEKVAEGSINGKDYSFERGKMVTVQANLAEHLLACGQATEIQ